MPSDLGPSCHPRGEYQRPGGLSKEKAGFSRWRPLLLCVTIPIRLTIHTFMSVTTMRLLAEFEALPAQEKQACATEMLRRLPRFDSGPLDDELVAAAGDELAAMLEADEHAAQTR
jgi:hypothetical protein